MSRLLLVMGVAFGLIGNLISASNFRLVPVGVEFLASHSNCSCEADCCVSDAGSSSGELPLALAYVPSSGEFQSLRPALREIAVFGIDQQGIPSQACSTFSRISPSQPLFLSFQVFLI